MRGISRAFATEGYPAVASGSTIRYTGRLVDEAGNPIAASDLDSLILSVVNSANGEVVNAVDSIDILNVDRGTVDNVGNLEIILQPTDTVLTGSSVRGVYAIVLDWTFGAGKRGRHQVDFKIEKLLD